VLGGGIVLVLWSDWGDQEWQINTAAQVSNRLAQQYRILYVCGEESGQQVKLRASRLVGDAPDQNPLLAPSTAGAMESAEAAQPTEKSAGADLYVLPVDLEEILRVRIS